MTSGAVRLENSAYCARTRDGVIRIGENLLADDGSAASFRSFKRIYNASKNIDVIRAKELDCRSIVIDASDVQCQRRFSPTVVDVVDRVIADNTVRTSMCTLQEVQSHGK